MNKIERNDPCWCGSGKKYKKCHADFDEKLARFARMGAEVPPHDIIKTPEQIEGIRESSKINIAVLDYVAEDYMVLANYIQSFPVSETTGLPTISTDSGYSYVTGNGRITIVSE